MEIHSPDFSSLLESPDFALRLELRVSPRNGNNPFFELHSSSTGRYAMIYHAGLQFKN